MDTKTIFNGDQMPVVVAEQRAKQIRLVEFQLEPGTVGDSGEVAAGHQAATL